MKVAVSYDSNGNILALFDPVGLVLAKGSFTYVPARGEQHLVLDLPLEFEKHSLQQLPELLRINLEGPRPILERREHGDDRDASARSPSPRHNHPKEEPD
jgi:hypothetical protein